MNVHCTIAHPESSSYK